MANEIVTETVKTLDSIKRKDENNKDYWDAHDLGEALGYTQYQKFKPAINRAIQQMEQNNINPNEHLTQSSELLSRTNQYGGISKRKVDSYKLDKRAAYTVAMNADPSKFQVAVAQEYFLQKTATAEKIEERMNTKDRLGNRLAYTAGQKLLAATAMSRDVESNEIGIVMDAGDKGFFNMSTKEVKEKNHIPQNRPVADYMSAATLAYKAVAQVNSAHEIQKHDLRGVNPISETVYDENRKMREAFEQKFETAPEDTLPEKDIKKIEKEFAKKGQEYLDALNYEA